MKLINKAAMFGLDARIALAIFGALSVISGAALYSAIQQAKVVSMVNELKEVNKAYEAYMLDTGSQLPYDTTHNYALEMENLISSSLKGWQGPYLSYNYSEISSTSEYNSPRYGKIMIRKYNNGVWGVNSSNVFTSPTDCSSGVGCEVFIGWTQLDDSIAKSIDKYIDGVSDGQNGRIRIYKGAGTSDIWYNSDITYK